MSLFHLVDNDLKLVIDVVEVFYSYKIVEKGAIGSTSNRRNKGKTWQQLVRYFSAGVQEVIRVEDSITSSVNLSTVGDVESTGFGSGSTGLTNAIGTEEATDEIVTRNRNSSLIQVSKQISGWSGGGLVVLLYICVATSVVVLITELYSALQFLSSSSVLFCFLSDYLLSSSCSATILLLLLSIR